MSDPQRKNPYTPSDAVSFTHFEALEHSQRAHQAKGKLSQLPCNIVFFDTATKLASWFKQMGHVCPNAEFNLAEAETVQLSHTEKNLFIFIPLQNVSLEEQAHLKPISSWLLERKKTYPLVSVSLLLSGARANVGHTSGIQTNLDLCKRAITWAESLAKSPLQRTVHLQFNAFELNLPSLVLTHPQLAEKKTAAPLEAWRRHCLHTLDRHQKPWCWVGNTLWLNSPEALVQCVSQLFNHLSSSKRHGRACPPDVIALHPSEMPLDTAQLHASHSNTRTAWLGRNAHRGLLLASTTLLLLVSLYLSLGWLRQSIVSEQLSNLQTRSRQLDVLNCTNIDSLEIADHQLQHLDDLKKSSLQLSAPLFKKQTRTLEAASIAFNERIQAWSKRCLLNPVQLTLSDLLERYLSLSNKKETVAKSHEQAYQVLKAYLMLFQLKNLNTGFLREQSIHILKSLNSDKNFDLTLPAQQMRADRLLSHALQQPELSFPASDTLKTGMVNEVRRILLTNQVAKNAEAQIFGRIIDTANGQLQSVGLLTEIGIPSLSYFENNPTILGAYTQGAFKSHVEGLIKAAARGELEQSDWVLDTQGSSEMLQPSDSLRAQLEARYWKAFELTWASALQSVSIKAKITTPELSALLTLFSDELSSPCKHLVVYLEQLDAKSLFNTDDAAFRNTVGIAKQNTEGQKPFSVYAVSLQNLSALNPSQMEIKPDEFFSNHWSENEGPSAVANDWVQRHLIVAQSRPLQEALRQFFLLPVQYWLNVQLAKNSKLLNSRWASDVLPRLKSISVRYPFNSRGMDATPEEMNEFLSVSHGVVSGFIQHNLKGALKVQGEQWRVLKRFGYAPGFETEFLTMLVHLGQVRSPLPGGNPLARFELRPIPNPIFIEQSFALEGQQIRYRNGPQIWSEFHWRGDQPQHLTRFNAQTTDGENCSGPSWTGRMSWVRALETANVEKSGSDWVLSWFPCADKAKKISFQYRHLQGLSPSDLLLLNHWPIPPRIFKEASL